jgi:predicted glycogen debranching enzyme
VSTASVRLACGGERDAAALRDREWLVTNGLGGYASGTVLGVPTRRYHGLFLPNLAHPEGRHLMIGRYDEELIAGDARALLGGADLEDGRTESDARAVLREFTLEGLTPTWRFEIGASTVEKSIVMPHGRNVVCVLYRLVAGPAVRLHTRPYAVFRRQDAPLVVAPAPFRLTIEGGRHELALVGSPLALRFRVRPDGVFVAHERTPACALYREERDRGYEHVELNFSPGYYAVDLRADRPVTFVATTDDWRSLEVDGEEAVAAERQRAEALLALAPPAARTGFPAQLALAADQFLVLPGSRLEEALRAGSAGIEVRTVIAGYHWFGDWGRDTMISLEGLTLATGRLREAAAILRTFARYVRDGLLPNLFPEGAREARYNTIDATLWYFHALDRFARACGSIDLVRELFPVLEDIVAHHLVGTRFGIGVDPADGLLAGGADGVALTWMDARFEDWVVTPRRGKPVEVQALWYNALCLMVEWAAALGTPDAGYRRRAAAAGAAFNARFWNARTEALFDVLDGPGGDDPSFRPNQILAVSLRFPILDEHRWRAVVDAVQARLLTPYGLRTLAPGEPEYRRDYHGDLRSRDAAYHQGTVWPWLIGHFVDAWLRVYRDPVRARAMLEAFPAHLCEAGVGSVSEICDAEPPFRSRACIAQAWSVAEVLRAWRATEPSAAAEAHGLLGQPLRAS